MSTPDSSLRLPAGLDAPLVPEDALLLVKGLPLALDARRPGGSDVVWRLVVAETPQLLERIGVTFAQDARRGAEAPQRRWYAALPAEVRSLGAGSAAVPTTAGGDVHLSLEESLGLAVPLDELVAPADFERPGSELHQLLRERLQVTRRPERMDAEFTRDGRHAAHLREAARPRSEPARAPKRR